MASSDQIALVAILVSFAALIQSFYFWRRSFRPIVTAMVRTNGSGNVATVFDLVLQNSGSVPARNVTLHIADPSQLERALDDASTEQRATYLSCFDSETIVPIIQNGAEISCSFGFVAQAESFWKAEAALPITIRYEGWFGKAYVEHQTLKIVSSKSFTGYSWRS